ncbi:hypothetical protein Nepgr_002977 [Nepenthes gracilis]|uniref:Uncharacterized protein n=1 Tax=Nepenthes gracilis TaxID=150966 RepID=A0AAD3XCP2_NEPGR|nr:hypothetical protein Nepgr_002977 [Nepenthes gracilis]
MDVQGEELAQLLLLAGGHAFKWWSRRPRVMAVRTVLSPLQTLPSRRNEINFWGSIYSTDFAVPHLRNGGGKMIVITSAAGWLSAPSLSFYAKKDIPTVSCLSLTRFNLHHFIWLAFFLYFHGFKQARQQP